MRGMSKFYTVFPGCRKFSQFMGLTILCLSASAHGPGATAKSSAGRRPANYVPNDDVIAVPVDAEINFYDKHVLNDKTWAEKSAVQRQVRIWQENETMAQQYGIDTQSPGSSYYVPTSNEKWAWLQRSYFRYLKKKGEDPFKQEGKDMWRNWTANDEVNSIDEMEAAFKATNHTTATGRPLPSALQEKVTTGKRFKLNFQPRLEQGLIIVRASSAWVEGRAWLGVNGESEFNLQRTFSTQTRIMTNYYAHSGEYLASVDQNLGNGFSARFTSSWDPENADVNAKRNQTTQLNYVTEF